MARTRTTKKLAQRVELNYFKRPTAFKRARLWLCVLVPLLAVAWIAWRGFARDSRVYSSGRMSPAHAVLEQQCGACHVQKAGEYSAKAEDRACLACHDGPEHYPEALPAKIPHCAECHAEHKGRISLSAVNDQFCGRCHANLKAQTGVSAAGPTYHETHIRSFEDGHPEFAAVQPSGEYVARDRGPKLNHAIHLEPIRRWPNGPNVQLECRDCHRVRADAAVVWSMNSNPMVPRTNWTYAGVGYLSAKPSYDDRGEMLPVQVLPAYKPLTGRESMAPVTFAKACAGCHSLAFDKRFAEGVPHDKTEVVDEFLKTKFQQYIAMHPEETRETREPDRDIAGKVIPTDFRSVTASQWVEEQTTKTEDLLWRKTCKQCHELRAPIRSAANGGASVLPQVVPDYGKYKALWMPGSKFDHDAHRGFSCLECHAKAMSSTESSDILLPGIAKCKTCHRPGPEHADSQCVECHTYHNWGKRREVNSAFTMPK